MPVNDGARAEGHLHKTEVPVSCMPASAHLRPHSMFTRSCMAQSSSLVSLTSLTQPSCTVQDHLKHCSSRQHGTLRSCLPAILCSTGLRTCIQAAMSSLHHWLARPAVLGA